MASEKQVAANRRNGLKGGVKTEEGKAVSRLNARTHGIFAAALTPEDSDEASGIEEELVASLRPAGRVEEMLVEKIALTYLRMQRCARAEAEFHIETWREPNKVREEYQWKLLQERRRDGARGSTFREEVFEHMVKLIDLYDARLTNQFLKLLHEIERQQNLRKGKKEEETNGKAEQPEKRVEAPPDLAEVREVPPASGSDVRSAPPGCGGTVGQDCPTYVRKDTETAPVLPEQAPAQTALNEPSQDAVGEDDNPQRAI
jgi:hypothetical protein